MAQYIQVSATSFGNAHSDDPTYAFTEGSGQGVYLSGSGGYVNSPTGITKATLSSGVKLKVVNDAATAVTCSVESGFTCTDEFEYATWIIPSPSPTVTPSNTPPNSSFISFEVEDSVAATPTYRLSYNINGYKAAQFDVVSNSGIVQNQLFQTATPNGTGTVTITRISPDATADAAGYANGFSTGATVSPSGNQTFNSGETVSKTFTISGFSEGDSVGFYLLEGDPP